MEYYCIVIHTFFSKGAILISKLRKQIGQLHGIEDSLMTLTAKL